MELGPEDMSPLERCPHFRGWYVQASKLGLEDVSLLEMCPHFRGWYVQASMELGLEDVSLLERCPHFRGWYVQASMELGLEDVSLLERCPHFRGWYEEVTYTHKQELPQTNSHQPYRHVCHLLLPHTDCHIDTLPPPDTWDDCSV